MAEDFHHEALLYADGSEYLEGTVPFLEEGLRNGEPMLVAVSAERIAAIRRELGPDGDRIRFEDMAELGANPARIIPAWRDFVDARAPGQPIRGIGEPIWAGRSPAELIECQRHEALLNVAFARTAAFRLLCPYDTEALDDAVIDEARRSHPCIVHAGTEHSSEAFSGLAAIETPFDVPLPEVPPDALEREFHREALPSLRGEVAAFGAGAGLSADQASDLALAANEVANNSVRYAGGGGGLMRLWRVDRGVVCEVSDDGRIDMPLAGRIPPRSGQLGGWGLWLANQLCDLVQVRTFPGGSVVRVHMHPR